MRILRTMVAAAILAAPIVTYTLPAAAIVPADDSNKNDAQILKEAQNKLKNKKYSGVQVSVENGIVKLSGTVPLYADKQDAEKSVSKVKGVQSVINDIQVQAGETTDEIAGTPGVDRREDHHEGGRAAAAGSVMIVRKSISTSESPKLYSKRPAVSSATTVAIAVAASSRCPA